MFGWKKEEYCIGVLSDQLFCGGLDVSWSRGEVGGSVRGGAYVRAYIRIGNMQGSLSRRDCMQIFS